MGVVTFFLVGDFAEVYGDDAKIVADICKTPLFKKKVNGELVTASGVPLHALPRYQAELGSISSRLVEL
jgi:DNA mismatch repair ATPase MutS